MITLLLLTSLAHAGSLAGVTLPDSAELGGKTVQLNGMGLREKFYIDVYVGGLYLEHKTHDGSAAIAADEPKRIVMSFIYKEVTREQILETFNEGFGAVATGPLKADVEKMEGWVPAAVKSGETMGFDYVPGTGTTFLVNGKAKGTIAGADFMKAVWGIYLGPKPPTANLKSGLLGG